MTIELLTRYAKLVIAFVVIWLLVWVYNALGCRRVEGSEMEPAIKRDTMKVMSPGVRSPSEYSRGDIVSYAWVQPGSRQQAFAARVIAHPGERVKIVKGEVWVNGERLKEDYVHAGQRSAEDLEEIIVPRDTLYVLADNRKSQTALDSRRIGPVSKWAIAGKL